MARPTLLLGPGDHTGSSTGDVAKFLSGEVKAALPGGISFVDARDVADVLPRLMERGEPGVGYLLGAVNYTIRDFCGLQLGEWSSGPRVDSPQTSRFRMGGVLKKVSGLSAFGGLASRPSRWDAIFGISIVRGL